jgi:hypothetical protein
MGALNRLTESDALRHTPARARRDHWLRPVIHAQAFQDHTHLAPLGILRLVVEIRR